MSSDAAAEIDAKLTEARPNGVGKPQPLRIVDPCALHGLPVPVRRWVVPEWVPVGVVTALYGPGGYGKSLLALQLMTATALGRHWLGVPVEPVRSLGLFCEDEEDELHRRQARINSMLHGCEFRDLGDMRWLPRLGEDNLLMTFGRSGAGQLTPLFGQVREAALDLAVGLIVIDTVADTFGGNQNDAGQVRQYVQFGLARLARDIGGAVLACAHPSRAGINSGSGESGSVQWDAAFRSRLYLSAPKKEEGDDEPDPDARVLTRVKANYAARDDTIPLRWHDGVLTAEGGTWDTDRPSAENVFLTMLDRMTDEGRPVSDNSRAGNYAPRLFNLRPAYEHAGYRQRDFEKAMHALFAMGEIRQEDYGRAGDRRRKIVRAEPLP